MAHSEIYDDGSRIDKFFEADTKQRLAEQLGNASSLAFKNGAVAVEQHIVHGNEPCPKCTSGIRFDLCCGKPKDPTGSGGVRWVRSPSPVLLNVKEEYERDKRA